MKYENLIAEVPWKNDSITRNFVIENEEKLRCPNKMSRKLLCEAITYCDSIDNIYAIELLNRARFLKKFKDLTDIYDKGKILRKAAKHFGIILI